ncbi:hypothetical protein BKA66DRAFT_601057 [Pyrenochaeta sp. MPI-SDFR-AT-0127]|nr:hypothetical protein BKA66DRAFT_601057 [Pyrenochaeta sp. MPI-SDFR-AT-0127]
MFTSKEISLPSIRQSLIAFQALCAAARIVSRCRSSRLPHLPLSDDAIVVTATLCALGSTVIISMAVDSGLGKRGCLLNAADMEQIQVKVFISTILFALAISISKCSILLYIHQVAGDSLHRIGAVVISILVLLWTIAILAGIVFQCEMPKPWGIWTGKCIPLFPFWLTATTIDIVIDIAMVLLSACTVWTFRLDNHQRALLTFMLSCRLILVLASITRLLCLRGAFSDTADPTFDFIPYGVTTQCHSTFSVILACGLILKPFTTLLQAARSQLKRPKSGHCKHWSGTTVGGTPYESFDSFTTNLEIIKEPLPTIQASMSNPTSPAVSRDSLSHDILLPEILLPSKYTKAPPRPPPPAEDQRPDLSIFTKKTVLRETPMVTRLGSVRDNQRGKAWERVGEERSLWARGLA